MVLAWLDLVVIYFPGYDVFSF